MICSSILLALAALVIAHPGQSQDEIRAEGAARWSYIASLEKIDLAHCATKLAARGVVERTINRRREALINLRKRADGK
jgi:sulfur relay (sulfurtransferase) complex TusBCD TusD component (DsrE family)